MPAGRLVTIEGIDGAGKTTLSQELVRALTDRGIAVELLREPGGVAASERVREVVKDPQLTIGPRAEALLYAAARAQLVEEAIRPRLLAGTWVLLDRFVDSSLAYQGAGRRLGIEAVREINAFATDGLAPDRTLWLALDPATARDRSLSRGEATDRLEQERSDFFTRIDRAYAELLQSEPERIRRIDASRASDEVMQASLDALADLL